MFYLKVNIVKGPMFKQQEKKAYEYLYLVISKKLKEQQSNKEESA